MFENNKKIIAILFLLTSGFLSDDVIIWKFSEKLYMDIELLSKNEAIWTIFHKTMAIFVFWLQSYNMGFAIYSTCCVRTIFFLCVQVTQNTQEMCKTFFYFYACEVIMLEDNLPALTIGTSRRFNGPPSRRTRTRRMNVWALFGPIWVQFRTNNKFQNAQQYTNLKPLLHFNF